MGSFYFFPSNTYLYVDEKRAYKIESLGNELLDTKYKFEKGITYTYKLYFPKISPGVENFSIFSFAKMNMVRITLGLNGRVYK